MMGESLAGAEVLIDRAKWSTLVMFAAFILNAIYLLVSPQEGHMRRPSILRSIGRIRGSAGTDTKTE
jgi:hypothetical protein